MSGWDAVLLVTHHALSMGEGGPAGCVVTPWFWSCSWIELPPCALQDDLPLPLGFFFLNGVHLYFIVFIAGSETGQKSHLKEVKYLSGFIVPVGKWWIAYKLCTWYLLQAINPSDAAQKQTVKSRLTLSFKCPFREILVSELWLKMSRC